MSSPEETGQLDQERMDAISGALARLLERQDAVEQRLLRIEGAMGLLAAAPPAPEPEPVREAVPPPLPCAIGSAALCRRSAPAPVA